MRENHPEGTEAARKVWEQVSDAREALHQLQLAYPNVIDYRITQSEEALRDADRLTRELSEGTTKELDAVRAQIAKDPSHPLNPLHGESNARFLAQIKDVHADEWRTLRAGQQDYETAWDGLAEPMQRHGLRYGELAGHIADMIKGDVLSAEDGTEFRLVRNDK